MAPPESPPPESLFCPFQENIDDVKITVWNTSKGLQGWFDLQAALKRRQTSLSPFSVVAQGRTTPVTPLVNPKTKLSSCYFIQMIDEEHEGYKVNCCLRDTDSYFMGFQRELALTKEEEKKKKDRAAGGSSSKGKKKKTEELKGEELTWERGNFYRFKEDDMIVPKFLNAKKLNIEAGYRKSPKPGGRDCIRHMFRAFSRYQDGTVPDEELEIACYCFMGTVSEPSRLLSLYLEVARRIAAGEFPSSLSLLLLDNIDNWGQFGREVLQARLLDRLGSYCLLPTWCHRHNLVIMRELIGHRGELLMIRINRELIGISEEKLREIEEEATKKNTGAAHRSDPGFELVVVD